MRYYKMEAVWILLIIQLEFIAVRNYMVNNDTYDDDTLLSVADDGTYNIEEIHNQQDDYNSQDYLSDNELEEKSRLLDFEENHETPDIKQNLKQHKNYRYEKKKRELNTNSEEEYTFRYQTDNVTEATYDYDKFKQEYNHDVHELEKSQGKLNLSDSQTMPTCGDGIFDKGPTTLSCLIRIFLHGETEAIREEAKKSILKLLKFWAIIFTFLFVFGWCWRGYCNWICPSKHCFPRDGYEEIKQELALNPPGSLTMKVDTKKDDDSETRFEKVYYKPTETERYLYKSLWNDIYRD